MENRELEGERQKVMHQREAVVIDAKDLQVQYYYKSDGNRQLDSIFRMMHFSCIKWLPLYPPVHNSRRAFYQVTGWFLLQVHWLSRPHIESPEQKLRIPSLLCNHEDRVLSPPSSSN
jgi:hypothetical protein